MPENQHVYMCCRTDDLRGTLPGVSLLFVDNNFAVVVGILEREAPVQPLATRPNNLTQLSN